MFSRVSSYFYIFSVVLFDNIRQSSIKCLYIKGFRCFKAHVLNYAISVPNCQKVPIFKHFRHFSTHFNKFSIKISLFGKYIRSRLVLIIIFSKLHTYIAPIHFVGCPFTIFNFYLTVFQCINQFQYINIKPI